MRGWGRRLRRVSRLSCRGRQCLNMSLYVNTGKYHMYKVSTPILLPRHRSF